MATGGGCLVCSYRDKYYSFMLRGVESSINSRNDAWCLSMPESHFESK